MLETINYKSLFCYLMCSKFHNGRNYKINAFFDKKA